MVWTAEAVETSEAEAGRLAGTGTGSEGFESGAGRCCPKKPGSRKVAGETLCVVLIPLHPVPSQATAQIRTDNTDFQNNRTR